MPSIIHEENMAGVIIEFANGKKGEIIKFSFVSDPKKESPEQADFFIVLAVKSMGTRDSHIKHDFFHGTHGGVKKKFVLYGKYLV